MHAKYNNFFLHWRIIHSISTEEGKRERKSARTKEGGDREKVESVIYPEAPGYEAAVNAAPRLERALILLCHPPHHTLLTPTPAPMATSSVLPLHLPSCARRASTALRASAAPAAATATTAQSLEESFGRKGLQFVADPAGGAPTAELSVRNGSSLHLRLGDGLVTSYKPKVYWKDDGCREVLYTVAGKGGVGLVLNEASSSSSAGAGIAAQWSLVDGAEWTVRDADSDSYDAVQVHFSLLLVLFL